MVPGLDYGLGEGEGMVLTEEEEREVMLHLLTRNGELVAALFTE